MKLNILVFKDTQLDCFTTPVFDDHDASDAAVQLARGIKQACLNGAAEKFKNYHYKEMYHVGVFDDLTGQIETITPVKLLECEKCFIEVEKKDA